MHPWRLAEVTFKETESIDYEVAVLGIGATEPHGYHLPHGTDYFETDRIVDTACEKAHTQGANVIMLPTLPFGVQGNMTQVRFPINLYQSTLNLILQNILESLKRNGIKKFVLVNGHGGNEFKPLLRDIAPTNEFFTVLTNWYTLDMELVESVVENRTPGGDHGEEMETSLCLHLVPNLVKMDQAGDGGINKTRFDFLNEGRGFFPRPWHLVTKDTCIGDPRKATAEKGKKMFEGITDRLGAFLVELSAAPMDKAFPYSSEFPSVAGQRGDL